MSTSTARLGHVPGAKVISYYADADGQFGTSKIGYDVDLFDEAVRRIAYGELRKKKDGTCEDQLAEKISELTTADGQAEPAVEADRVEIKKEDVQFICVQLEVNAKTAENALTRTKGSLEEALLNLIREPDCKK